MKKIALITIPLAGICFTLLLGSCTFLTRYVALNYPDVMDYKKLPVHQIANDPENTFHFVDQNKKVITRFLPFEYGENHIDNLDSFMTKTKTSAFIVIRNDSILLEKYCQGNDRKTRWKIFSATKSVISALIGIAIDEGFIKSADDQVMQYVPEIKDERLGELTIRHCLAMTSGIKSDDGEIFPWNDKVRVYYSRDIRKLLSRIDYQTMPGQVFQVEEITPMLLGLVLERAIGRTISAYLEEKIWKPLGMENSAMWVIDSKKKGFEVVNSGLVATPIDMAKFGRLYLMNGIWNGKSIVSSNWVSSSTRPDTTSLSFWRAINAYQGSDVYFRDTWWGLSKSSEVFEYSANGHFGQRIYIVPYKNILILRFGSGTGKIDWTGFIQELVTRL